MEYFRARLGLLVEFDSVAGLGGVVFWFAGCCWVLWGWCGPLCLLSGVWLDAGGLEGVFDSPDSCVVFARSVVLLCASLYWSD